jgi:hypothetical protein
MPNGEHQHPQEPNEDYLPGHPEHGDYWPARVLTRPRASAAISQLLAGGHGDTPDAAAVVERLSGAVEAIQQLDGFVEHARLALLGDAEALSAARTWLKELVDRPPRPPDPTEPHHGMPTGGHDPPTESGHLEAGPWMHPSALLDVTIGAAFTAIDLDRPAALHALSALVRAVARPVAVTMTILRDIPPGLEPRDQFRTFVDRLDGFDRFDAFPLDLDGCLANLMDVLSRPNGSISQATQASELEVDDNSGRIVSVAPDPVCTDARLTLTADTQQPFVERSGVTVAFAPCGQLGRDIAWTPSAVTVTVPSGAKSGNVYFAKPNTLAETTLPDIAAIELAGVFGDCPFLGRGSSTSIMVGSMRGALYNGRCFLPLSVGVPVTVVQAPEIAMFRAVAKDGSPITNQSMPGPDDSFTLEWEVTAGGAIVTDISLRADGVLLAQGLGLRANHVVAKAQVTKKYTLTVTSGCGVIQRDLTVGVMRVLRFAPPGVSINQGQTATLTLVVDRPSSTATTIFLTTTPGHPTAPGWATLPAGQTSVQIGYPNIQPGPPHAAALTVTAFAPRHTSPSGQIWVERPLGTREIVASRTGGTGLASIDVVGVHAALTTSGSVLLFAYDESPSTYADINVGKSAVWNPRTSQLTSLRMSRNLFCAGHAFLGDGRVLVAGGQSAAITVGGWIGSALGLRRGADHDLHTFDGSAWSRVLPDMPGARWYPTCVTLPDGRVLIISGYAAHAYGTVNGDYEIFDGASNSLVKRSGFKTLIPYNHEFDIYPFMQVLPGRNLFVHSHDTTWLLPLSSSNEPVIGTLGYTPYYNAASTNSRTYPGEGACVMLPLDPDEPTKARILLIGGGGGPHGGIGPTTPASDTAEIFDFDSSLALDAQPQWRFTADPIPPGNQTFMTNPRLMADAVLLPDGTVSVIGGAGGGEADQAWPPIMWIESFDPATETFTSRTGITVPRLYHSTALLLPDGSVMIAGSTGWRWDQSISGGSANEFRIEVYRPPYLFRGPRPVFTLPGNTLTYGQSLSIGVPTGAKGIKKVALIRHGSTTHTINMDQRYVGLKITSSTDTGLTVTLPPDGAVAPPGPYLLFVIGNDANNAPVPSVGTSVMLGS